MSAFESARPQRLPIYALLAGNAISFTGNMLAAVAIPWFVLVTTGSPAKTGITAFFTFAPAVLSAFFGGTLVDRIGFKRMGILADLASGVAVALIPLFFALDLLSFPLLLALVFLGALLDAPGNTARFSLYPDLAAAAQMRLERANSLTQAVERTSRLIGAPLAGVLIAVFGTENVLWLDAASFLISATLMWLFVPDGRAPAAEAGSYIAQLRAGLCWIRGERMVLTLLILISITNCLDVAFGSTILPVYARETFGTALSLGLLIGANAGGAVVSALAFAEVGHRLPRRPTFIWGFVGATLMMPLLLLTSVLPVAVATRVASGIFAGPINPVLGTIFQERIPPAMRGRVFGLMSATAMCAMPAGALLGGFLVEWLDVRVALLAVAAASILTTLSFFLRPELRHMDAPADAEPTAAGAHSAVPR